MSNRARWFLVFTAAILPLLGWWTTGLFDLDEGFYAAVVTEMNRRGEWITPYYNGSPWFEKPILLYWMAKPCIALFGPEFGPRLPSVLCTIALYGLVGWFGSRRFSVATAQLAVLILGGSLLFVALGRMMMTDMPLVLFLTAALFCSWESRDHPRLKPIIGVCLGLAVLAKGPVALIFYVAIWGWLWIRHPGLRKGPCWGTVASWMTMLATIALWYLPAYLQNGQVFVQEFLIEQNIGRFSGGDAAHTLGLQSIPFYLPILLVGMLPWSLWVPTALLKRRTVEDPDLGSFLASWAVIVFLFFSVGGAKLPHYILPVLPPLALLVAARLRDRAFAFAIAWCLVIAIVANAGLAIWYRESGQSEAHQLATVLKREAGDTPVAFYQLGRRQSDRGTGSTKLQETSLPSMIFYVDRVVTDTDDFDEILTLESPTWIFTRSNRITDEEISRALSRGRSLEKVTLTEPPPENFALYRLQ